ncbi:MAG: DHH family phosphoesterase [Candidatus Woesebacteria bacterium]
MKSVPSLDSLKEKISSIHKALILMSSTPNIDSAASALGLFLVLRKKGIDVQIACPADMRVEFSRLVGVDEVKKKIGNRNLVVSFDYNEDKVEKVSYTISDDGKRFNLVIAPKTGVSALDPATVAFDYAGVEADATFLIGVNGYTDIGSFYEEERNVIEGSFTIAFTLFPVGTYAQFHADASGMSSLAEMVANVCVQLDLPLENDSASNFLYGLDSITQSLNSPTVSADTFETVAALLRAGGKRQPVGQQGTLSPNQMPFLGNSATQPVVSGNSSAPASTPVPANNNPFAAALSKTAQAGGTMPAGYSATGELKG